MEKFCHFTACETITSSMHSQGNPFKLLIIMETAVREARRSCTQSRRLCFLHEFTKSWYYQKGEINIVPQFRQTNHPEPVICL